MAEKVCIQCHVSGKVQGVFFRASTQEEAEKLGLVGFAKNLPDGRVEVIACGDRDKVMELLAWLNKGPDRAEVTDLIHKEIPWEEHKRFATY